MAVVRIVPKFNAPGPSEMQASFWMDIQPTPTLADVTEVSINITDWLQDMYDLMAPLVKNVITAAEYVVFFHDLVTGLEDFYFDGGWTFAGGTASDYALNQQAATISAKRVGAPRPAQKRMIPFAEGETNEGLISAGAITALGNFGAQWTGARAPSAGFTYEPGCVTVGAPGFFTPFSGVVSVNTVSGTVGSRKRGRGI